MGRIKTQYIKNLTHRLMERYGEQLTDSFEKNKEIIGKLIDPSPKRMRNIVAGYATKIVKMRKIKD